MESPNNVTLVINKMAIFFIDDEVLNIQTKNCEQVFVKENDVNNFVTGLRAFKSIYI